MQGVKSIEEFWNGFNIPQNQSNLHSSNKNGGGKSINCFSNQFNNISFHGDQK